MSKDLMVPKLDQNIFFIQLTVILVLIGLYPTFDIILIGIKPFLIFLPHQWGKRDRSIFNLKSVSAMNVVITEPVQSYFFKKWSSFLKYKCSISVK